MTRLALFALALLAGTSAWADDKVVQIDLRKKPAGADKFTIVLCARPHDLAPKKDPNAAPTDAKGKTVGHAWVVWGIEDATRKESRYDAAFGFYPVKGAKPFVFGSVPGELVDQLKQPRADDDFLRITHRLIAVVDADTYKETLQIAARWKKEKPEYSLLQRSCKTFTNEVAKALGLTTQDEAKFDWPEDMLAKLIEASERKSK